MEERRGGSSGAIPKVVTSIHKRWRRSSCRDIQDRDYGEKDDESDA
jgi:hypothetical protein